MKKWHVIFLAIWLIATGVLTLLNVSFTGMRLVMTVLEIVAGVCLLLSGKKIKDFHHFGALLLSIFLIASGVIALLNLRISILNLALGIVALAAGVMLPVAKRKFRLMDRLAAVLLTVWLVLTSLMILINLNFSGSTVLLSLLTIAAGTVLILKN